LLELPVNVFVETGDQFTRSLLDWIT